MIDAILSGIFKLIISLVNLLLWPIDLAIENALPSVATGLGYVGDFFDYILGFIPYILSWFHLPDGFIGFVIAYWTFVLTVPLAIHTVKVAIAWYNSIKP